MIYITTNSEPVSLGEALLHLTEKHLRYKFQVVHHHINRNKDGMLVIISERGGGRVFQSVYKSIGFEPKNDFLQLLQVVQMMLDKGMEDIPMQSIFYNPQLRERIHALKGDMKARAILGCMGGVPQDVARSLVARDYKTEEVCMAYALHVEDPSVPMLELLAWQYKEA